MVTMLASIWLFGAPVTPQLALAIVLVATSTVQYNMPASWLEDKQAESQNTDHESECAEPTARLLGSASQLAGFSTKRHSEALVQPADE
eukprot:scaffold29649_cov79-Isochrysis_galbana.AAC.1